MRKEIGSLGGAGVIKDLFPWQLPENAVTASDNIRFSDGQASTFPGHSDYLSPTVLPYYVTSIAKTSTYFWVYCGLDEIYTGSTNITRNGGGGGNVYTGTSADRWNSTQINGFLILNNGIDVPQSWIPSTGNDCINLTGWNANHTAKIVRTYKDFLFALDITKSGTRSPYMVKWSDAASNDALPASWDETDTTGEAGENTSVFAQTDGLLLDAVALRDSLYIYKEDSVYGCQFIGGTFIFRFWRLSGLIGCIAQQCVADLGDRHFVLGDGDCYVHNGQDHQSVIDKKNRDTLFNLIDADNYTNCFVRHHKKSNEVWVCYPYSGQTFPDRAFIWNYVDDTWTQRDLPTNTTSMDYGVIDTDAYNWKNGSNPLPWGTWLNWPGTWGSRTYSPLSDSLVSASLGDPVDTGEMLYQYEDGNQFAGSNITCTIEKTNIELGQGQHMIKAIHPYADGGSFNVYVGSQMHKNDPVSWEGPFAFNPLSNNKVRCRVTGKYHSVRFTSTDNVAWSISAYGIEYESAGLR